MSCLKSRKPNNHLSGGLEPSAEDRRPARHQAIGGRRPPLGIELLDHIIVTAHSYTSLKERKLI